MAGKYNVVVFTYNVYGEVEERNPRYHDTVKDAIADARECIRYTNVVMVRVLVNDSIIRDSFIRDNKGQWIRINKLGHAKYVRF